MTIRSADDVEGVIAFVAAQTSDVILRASAAGVITYISPTIRRYGYEPEQLVGASIGGCTCGCGASGASFRAIASASVGSEATATAPAAIALVARKSRRVVMSLGCG